MKNPTLKLLTFAIAGLLLGLLPNAAEAQTEYFGNSSGLANGQTYSWDAANWGNASTGPFVNVWTNGNFARFYGGAGISYTVTVNQAELNDGWYNDNASSILTINDAGNGTGSLAVTNGQQGVLVTSGSITIVNCPITGVTGGTAGGLVPELSGSLYLGSSNSYAGGTVLGDSGNTLVYFNNNNSFGTGGITLNRTGNFSTLLAYGYAALTISNNFSTVAANTGASTDLNFASSNNTPVTVSGTWTLTTTLNLRSAGGSSSPLTLSGQISGTTNLIFSANTNADGTLSTIILSATNSGFTGLVEVTGPNGTYGGNTNAILQLGAQNAIAAARTIVLAGGTLIGGGFNHTNVGTLGLSNSSSLYFGGGNMIFASSSTLPWTGVLDLVDWSGTGSTYGGTQFRIGTSGSGLTSAQLADIEFNNTPSTLGDAAIDPNGYIYNAASAPGPTFSVTAANSLISQPNNYGNPPSTTFTITRGGSLASTLTVNYTITGTALGATNAGFPSYPTTFTAPQLTGTAVFAPNQTSSNITVTAVSDSIARPTTALTLTLSASANYNVVAPPIATITILNTAENEVFATAGVLTNIYKPFSNDFTTITLTRWGDTNASAFTVNNYTSVGTAVQGVDYAVTATTINPGDQSDTAYVNPLINGQPAYDTNGLPFTGNKTVIASVANGSSYNGSTNTVHFTIIDNAYPSAAYLLFDPLTNSMDSTNWGVRSANDNMQNNSIDDYIDFAYDLTVNSRDPIAQYQTPPAIPLPPNGGATALRLTVNKTQPEGEGAAAGVNIYMTNAFLSGNYAVRFNMNLTEGANPLYTTEGAIFGFNHTGQATNWWDAYVTQKSGWAPPPTATNWENDGIWAWVSVDDGISSYAGGPADYVVLTGNGGKLPNTGPSNPLGQASKSQFAYSFKTNLLTSPQGPGLAANASPDDTFNYLPNADSCWVDVEFKQFNNVVTLSIDKNPICVFTNTSSFTNGYVMLGYQDPSDSVGAGDAAVYYSNLRAVQLTAPVITGFAPSGNNYVFYFTTTDGDLTPSSFTILGATSLNPPVSWSVVSGATITQLGNTFQVSVPKNGNVQFYRIQEPL